MKQLTAFLLVLVLLFSQVCVCFARTVSTYDVLLNMDPSILSRFQEGGVSEEMMREFMGILDEEADRLQKPEDRETLENYFLSLLLLYVFQREKFVPVMVAFDQQFPEEVTYIAETGRVPESMELFFLSVMGRNIAYSPPDDVGGPPPEEPAELTPSPEPTPTVTPEPTPPPPFGDLADYEWVIPSIWYLYEKELIAGYPDGTFGPQRSISRAELTALVTEAFLDKSYRYDTLRYPDVSENDWFYQDLLTAEYFSLFQWIYDEAFQGDVPVTRQELCAILYRAYRRSGNPLPISVPRFEFLDFSKISAYAYDPIQLLQQAGCVSGYENGCFLPQQIATRAEAVKLLASILRLQEENE